MQKSSEFVCCMKLNEFLRFSVPTAESIAKFMLDQFDYINTGISFRENELMHGINAQKVMDCLSQITKRPMKVIVDFENKNGFDEYTERIEDTFKPCDKPFKNGYICTNKNENCEIKTIIHEITEYTSWVFSYDDIPTCKRCEITNVPLEYVINEKDNIDVSIKKICECLHELNFAISFKEINSFTELVCKKIMTEDQLSQNANDVEYEMIVIQVQYVGCWYDKPLPFLLLENEQIGYSKNFDKSHIINYVITLANSNPLKRLLF